MLTKLSQPVGMIHRDLIGYTEAAGLYKRPQNIY